MRTSVDDSTKLCRKVIAPLIFEGTCTTGVFNAWLKEAYLPVTPKGQILCVDNASIHISQETRLIMADAGCTLLFLPTYSPDFNPIEHFWHQLKSNLKTFIQDSAVSFMEKVTNAISRLCNPNVV